MSAGGWGCPHELNDRCGKVDMRPCDPGMKGCELAGRYVFFDDGKNSRLRQKNVQRETAAPVAVAPQRVDSDD
jgi:hypothetical protein